MQPDQLGLRGANPRRPQSLNRYSYVYNDPINFIDPTGLLPVLVCSWRHVYGDSGWIEIRVCEIGDEPERIDPREPREPVDPDQIPDYDPTDDIEKFFRENPGCREVINKKLKAAGLEGTFSEATLKGFKWLYAGGMDDKTLKRLKLSDFGETGKSKNENLYSVFNNKSFPADAVAIWTGNIPTVITYFNLGIQPRSTIAAHESLHILFKGDHRAVAEKLGLGTFAGNEKEAEKAASIAINKFLNDNCGVKREGQ
jgi:hypothetical protein